MTSDVLNLINGYDKLEFLDIIKKIPLPSFGNEKEVGNTRTEGIFGY